MAIITLLTDYGTVDSYVGEMKGVLLSLAPGVTLVDLTHELAPGDVASAAYVVSRAWHRFPPGTVHLAVVDPGVGTARAALAFATRGHFFVGPDNGLWSGVMHGAPVEAVTLATPPLAAPTFHGRDLFAPVAARLALGEPLATLGAPYGGIPRRVSGAVPRHEGKLVVGEVIYVDRYGNLVTNLTPEFVPPYAVLEAESLVIGPLRTTFGDVASGGILAYIGSGGQVEIAVRDGSAARRLGLGVGGRVRARLG
jgi:S-adenosylmethionine hydrolase